MRVHSQRRRGGARGQIVVIFALMSSVLFVTVGIAVDAGMAYLFSNQAERAAAAAALAGVPYMPGGYGTTASGAAQSAATRNGFTDGATVNGYPVTVVVWQVGPAGCTTACGLVASCLITSCDSHKLGVVVTAAVPTTFLNLLGFRKTTVSQHAIALYLPPIDLGQPGSRIGPASEADLSNPAKSAPYFIRTEGYGVDRSQGDAYTPDTQTSVTPCDSGPSYGPSGDVHGLSGVNGTEAPTPAGFNALPSRGGYNFTVNITAGTANIQVYNPAFMMDGQNTGYTMHEGDSFPATPTALNYSVMEYTVFRVPDQFDHTQDVPITQLRFNPFNVGAVSDVDENTGKPVTVAAASALYHNMVNLVPAPPTLPEPPASNAVSIVSPIGSALGPGIYRVRVDTLDNVGGNPGDGGNLCSQAHKGLSIQAVAPSGVACSCSVSGLQDLSIFTPLAAGSFTIPIFSIPADYAGLTVNAYIYDAGDTTGDATMTLLQPVQPGPSYTPVAGNVDIEDVGVNRQGTQQPVGNINTCVSPPPQSASVASFITRYNASAVTNSCAPAGHQSGNNPWNGQWIRITFTIPASYNPAPGDYYQLQYQTGGTSSDTITVGVGSNAVAVHLLP